MFSRNTAKLVCIGILFVPGFAFVNLTGTGYQWELIRYIIPALVGSLAGLFIATSLTDIKQVEEKLRKSSTLLAESQRIAHLGSWDLDRVQNEMEWSDEVYRILEIDSATCNASYNAFLGSVHPDDKERVHQAYTNSLLEKNRYTVEYRLLMSDGRVKYVCGQCESVFDEEERAVSSFGTIQDITRRKRAEMATEKERATLQLIIDSISDSIMVMNMDYETVLMNKAAKVSFNPDFINESNHPKCYEISHHTSVPCSGNEYPCPLQEVIKKGTLATYLHKHRHADGTPRYVELKASPLRSEDGTLSGVIEVARDITQHITIQDELREKNINFDYLAHYDQLTQLPNRLLLHDRLKQALRVAERRKQSLGLLLLDLDNFKNVNDSLGHEIGDFLLIEVAERVLKCLRESDTVARLGGDEFVVLLPDCKNADNITEVTQKILSELSASFDLQGNEVFISASIGIAMYPDDGNSAEVLFKNADTAMYHVKDGDKNNFQFFTASMQEHIANRLRLTAQLRHAVEKKEFVLHYQPKMDITTGRVHGMEALVRWQHPDDGLLSPSDFIPLAEETGIIVPLGQWVLRQACLQAKAWQVKGVDSLCVSVNLSARQFQDEELVEMVKTVLQDTGLEAGFLELEIAESTVMENIERSIQILWQLRDLGMLLSIDNFGTGNSTLNYLKRLPLDILKIDRSFVGAIMTDPSDRAIVEAIVSLSRHLKMKVVAEGVETKEQLDLLEKEKCHKAQGYYIARPLPAHEFEDFVLKNRQERNS